MEKVLVIEKSILENHLASFKNTEGVYTLPVGQDTFFVLYRDILLNLKEMDRDEAEKDENYKQIIPYCVVIYFEDTGRFINKKVLYYERTKKSGEQRLVNKGSVGFGGHCNKIEDVSDVIMANARKELTEELGLSHKQGRLSHSGFIYDSTNEVGRVHLGVVLELELEKIPTFKVEDHLCNVKLEWTKILKEKDNLENWSKIVIKEFI